MFCVWSCFIRLRARWPRAGQLLSSNRRLFRQTAVVFAMVVAVGLSSGKVLAITISSVPLEVRLIDIVSSRSTIPRRVTIGLRR
jgi:hypothetical protein